MPIDPFRGIVLKGAQEFKMDGKVSVKMCPTGTAFCFKRCILLSIIAFARWRG